MSSFSERKFPGSPEKSDNMFQIVDRAYLKGLADTQQTNAQMTELGQTSPTRQIM